MRIRTWHQLKRPLRLILVPLAALLLFLAVFPKSTNPNSPHPLFGKLLKSQGFHFLLPAAQSNPGLCRAVLSSAASGYPDPVLPGWEGRGLWNGSESQLFKVSETLAYFRTLRKSQDNDLVLLADAQESLFQLPPDITIQRYRLALDKGDAWLKDQRILGKKGDDGIPLRSSILLAATNKCGPVDPSKGIPACETISSASARKNEFLHSGALMGTVKDIRELFLAVMTKIDEEFNEDFQHRHMIQHYLSLVWEVQESARKRLRKGEYAMDVKNGAPRAEFGIALDHDGDAFLAGESVSEPVTWRVFNQTQDGTQLPSDIKALGDKPLVPVPHTWADMTLGVNTGNGIIFPIAQVSGDLANRNAWWTKLWFHIHAEATHKGARQRHLSMTVPETSMLPQPEMVVGEARNVKYVAAQGTAMDPLQAMRSRDKENLKGGVWNDLGEYMTWDEVCKAHEGQVYLDR